ncbi:MAG: hypothetical protein Q8K93_09110, partial [Reyranella sp.]|nr:hypothetical protein [Reyranella sp.]
PEDWTRLVSVYGETGGLIHPRLERRERSINDLPALPVSYVESTPFVAAAEDGSTMMPIPDDPGVPDFGGGGNDGPAPSTSGPRRRRLASAKRAAK